MKQTITLDRNDIEHIIAEHFHTKKSCVDLHLVPIYSGYGLGEHKDIEIEAQIMIVKEME